MGRRFHRNQAQHLQQMVLQHVPQRTGVVVVPAAGAHAKRFGDRDLHVVDRARVPQRFQEGVGEPGHEQVLHAFLAEVVVDAKDLGFVEYRSYGVVDGTRRCEIVADRLLQDHPRRCVDQPVGGQMCRDRAERAGRAGQVEHPDLAGIGRQQRRQRIPAIRVGEIDTGVVQPSQESIECLRVESIVRDKAAQLAAHFVAITGNVESGARGRDDAGFRS